MNAGHFSYLLSPSPQIKVASDRLELLAKAAAKRYLEDGVALNETISKIASENDLNTNQIQRVCEMANISTHQALWQKTADKTSVAFPLADAKTIVVAKKPATSPCEAAAAPAPATSPCSDYSGPPTGVPAPGPSLVSMMGADPAQVHHGLGEEPEKKRIIIIMQKKAAEKAQLRDQLLYKGMELETAQEWAYKQVKQAALAGVSFSDMYRAAVGSGLDKVAAELLPGFEERLMSEGYGNGVPELTKEAISRAPAELISNDLGNMTVINGAHPVLISLDTVQRKTGEIKNGLHNMLRIDDEVKMFGQRLKELS